MWRKRFAILVAFYLSLAVLAGADFILPKLPQPVDRTFDLGTVANRSSYYDFMHSQLGPRIQKFAAQAKGPETDQPELKAGHGVTVKLSQFNFNIHVNYPNASEGGRSYGWTRGEVGDWSDKVYLDHLAAALKVDDTEEVAKFCKLLIQMLGACNAVDNESSIETLSNPASESPPIFSPSIRRKSIGRWCRCSLITAGTTLCSKLRCLVRFIAASRR